MPNLVSLTSSNLLILDKINTGVFPISRYQVNPLYKKSCRNSRTNDNIDMEFGPVTKSGKRNKKKRQKKIDYGVISENFDLIVIFLIYGQFGAIQKQDSGRRICKTYNFIKNNRLSYRN